MSLHYFSHFFLATDLVNLILILKGSRVYSYLLLLYVIYSFLTLEQIIVLNEYSYNKHIPKISHIKIIQDLCKMRYK